MVYYMPGAQVLNHDRFSGGTYVDGPFRIVLHSTEYYKPSYFPGDALRHRYPPHVWYDPGSRALAQTVTLDRSAFALRRNSGDPQTNKQGALQVEIYGKAALLGSAPVSHINNLVTDVVVPFALFAREKGKPINFDGSKTEHNADTGYGYSAPQRMGWYTWRHFNGLCAHRHVPGNTHSDTGGLNLPLVVDIAKQQMALIDGGISVADAATIMAKLGELETDIDILTDLMRNYISNRHSVMLPDGQVVDNRARLEDFVRRAIQDMIPTIVGSIEFPDIEVPPAVVDDTTIDAIASGVVTLMSARLATE